MKRTQKDSQGHLKPAVVREKEKHGVIGAASNLCVKEKRRDPQGWGFNMREGYIQVIQAFQSRVRRTPVGAEREARIRPGLA